MLRLPTPYEKLSSCCTFVFGADALKRRMFLFLPLESDQPLLSPTLRLQRTCPGCSRDGLGAISSDLRPFNPATFQKLSLPIRTVVHVIIVILFSKTSPLSVSLPLVVRRSHLALPLPAARGKYSKHVRGVISSTALYNQAQSDGSKVGKVAQICKR